MVDDPWDRNPNREPAKAQDEIVARLERSSAAARGRASSDRNTTVPRPEKNPATGNYIYETAPVPLERLFGSPLAMKGPNAYGAEGIRRISSGWGDPRSNDYGAQANRAALHQALDYIAPYGEDVYAAADGTVTFVGFQEASKAKPPKSWATFLDGITTDNAKAEIYNKKGEVVGSKALNNIGFGGVAVWIDHDGDFQGYRTEYYHLSAVHVPMTDKQGKRTKVKEGDLIGSTGGTGGYYNWFYKGYHLHFQVAFVAGGLRALVRPTALIPNYWPNHLDSTNSNVATNIIMPALETMGLQMSAGRAANALSALNRATSLQNKTGPDFKNGHATHAEFIAQTMDVHRTAVHAASMGFQGKAPVVEAPLTFDFSNGVWSVGSVVKGPL